MGDRARIRQTCLRRHGRDRRLQRQGALVREHRCARPRDGARARRAQRASALRPPFRRASRSRCVFRPDDAHQRPRFRRHRDRAQGRRLQLRAFQLASGDRGLALSFAERRSVAQCRGAYGARSAAVSRGRDRAHEAFHPRENAGGFFDSVHRGFADLALGSAPRKRPTLRSRPHLEPQRYRRCGLGDSESCEARRISNRDGAREARDRDSERG